MRSASLASNGHAAPSARELANQLLALAVEQLELGERSYMPGFQLPRSYGGHPVGSDARSDLAFTLGLLWECGIRKLAGILIEDAVASILRQVDGASTHTFYSYRIAETLARFGDPGDNSLLQRLSPRDRSNLSRACDSTSWAARVRQGRTPRNFCAVLARCAWASRRLGLAPEDALLTEMVGLTRALLTGSERGVDDSQTGICRYDIYSADIYLFSEPLAEALGSCWLEGLTRILDLIPKIAAANGSAFAWGRSLGPLGMALTIELAGLTFSAALERFQAPYLALAVRASRQLRGWFGGGVTNAHQHRSSDPYRGPARRLQMTFDLLGKVADAARRLLAAPDTGRSATEWVAPPCDELLWFRRDRLAGVWAYRAGPLAFSVPLSGCTTSDYLPGPRSPGLFEGPVDGLPTAVPVALANGTSFVGAGLPEAVDKSTGALTLRFGEWLSTGQFERKAREGSLAGTREVTFRVENRTVRARERLSFPVPPDALGIQIAESEGRPLRVVYECASPHTTTVVETAGMAEWRSFWGELPRVHQLDVEPAGTVEFSWSVQPLLRVLTSDRECEYHRGLYRHLTSDVVEGSLPPVFLEDPSGLPAFLGRWDVFHLHWPEWFLGNDPTLHQRLIGALEAARVKVVWTQHNITPHSKDPAGPTIYGLWAEAADAVLHHSRWGRDRILSQYRFRSDAAHAIVPHLHFGGSTERGVTRAQVERALGLRPDVLRLGIVGAPRKEKLVERVMRAVQALRRDDLELLVLSLGPHDTVPDSPRIKALPYERVPRAEYQQRLQAIDLIVLPFEREGMLTTGIVGDVVGAGLPALISDWPFLVEVLGEAGLCYGQSEQDLTAYLEGLTPGQVERAASASRALQARHAPASVARELLAVIEGAAGAR